MAFLQVEFFSEVLRLSSSIQVILPERKRGEVKGLDGRKNYPVLYLLHGGSDNHTNWARNTSIERYVTDKELIVVMPSVQYSFYSDQKHGYRYFKYISEEVPAVVEDLFHASKDSSDRFAAGISMGGYGAFKLGICCPDRYAAVASISGSLDQRSRMTAKPGINNTIMLEMARLTFGSAEEYENSSNDLAYVLEQKLESEIKLPKFYQICGTADHNYEINNEFYRRFEGKVDLQYDSFLDKGHNWAFWDEQIQQVLHWLPLQTPDL